MGDEHQQGRRPWSNLYQSTRAVGDNGATRGHDDTDESIRDRELAAKLVIYADGGGTSYQGEKGSAEHAVSRESTDNDTHEMLPDKELSTPSRTSDDQTHSNGDELNEWLCTMSKSAEDAFEAFEKEQTTKLQHVSVTDEVLDSSLVQDERKLQVVDDEVKTEEHFDDWIGMKKTVAGVYEKYAKDEVAKTERHVVANRALALNGVYPGEEDSTVDELDLESGGMRCHHQREHRPRPGAFRVGGEVDATFDDFTVVDSIPMFEEITAELVDEDMEARRVREQVQRGIETEINMAPVAEAVPERFCDGRKTLLVLVFTLLLLLGIVLGVILAPDRGPPPAPVPPMDEIVKVLSVVSSDGGEAFQRPGSPQNRAFNWIANDTFQGYRTDEKLVQRYALATLFFSTEGESWVNNSLWLDENDECDRWWQVSCDFENGHAVSLVLAGNNLAGLIPAEIGLVSILDVNFAGNHLKGTIPTEIGMLNLLKSLTLQSNKLTGTIPPIDKLTNLESISLRDNVLTGKIPSEIGLFTHLKEIALLSNELTGPIPQISDLTSLTSLNLYNNKLTGTIPPMERLTLLHDFHLRQNELTGTLPNLGALRSLRAVNLRSNNIGGTLSTNIGLLSRTLESLALRDNLLNGTLPTEVGLLTALTSLSVKNNRFSGTIPSEIYKLTGPLADLTIGNDASRGNTFRGSILDEIQRMTNLETIMLSNIELSGTIPSVISQLTNLRNLELNGNQLSGTIPPVFDEMHDLSTLSLYDNDFTGNFMCPVAVEKCLVSCEFLVDSCRSL